MFRVWIGAAAVVAVAAWLVGCDDDCSSLSDEARELRNGAAACGAGDSCVFVDMYEMAGENNCLGAFQCSHALNAAADLDAFRREARRIRSDYSGCSECVIADCVDTTNLVARCDVEARRCVAEEVAP